jgi:hypothetical protein
MRARRADPAPSSTVTSAIARTLTRSVTAPYHRSPGSTCAFRQEWRQPSHRSRWRLRRSRQATTRYSTSAWGRRKGMNAHLRHSRSWPHPRGHTPVATLLRVRAGDVMVGAQPLSSARAVLLGCASRHDQGDLCGGALSPHR